MARSTIAQQANRALCVLHDVKYKEKLVRDLILVAIPMLCLLHMIL